MDGLVSRPTSLSLAELQALPSQSQITMHTCMQGWTGIAKWTGVRVSDLLAQAGQIDPEGQWVMFESFGKAQHMHDGRPVEPYYTCLPLSLALEEDTILAWGRNDAPLSPMFGAPLRLRCESGHGYKMVKWVRSVTVIRDYCEVGDGMGAPERTRVTRTSTLESSPVPEAVSWPGGPGPHRRPARRPTPAPSLSSARPRSPRGRPPRP